MTSDEKASAEVVYKPAKLVKDKILLEDGDRTKGGTAFLYFSAIIVNLPALSALCSFLWISPAVPILRSDDANLNPLGRPITVTEEALIGGIWILGSMSGNLTIGKLLDIYGRKRMLMFAILLLTLSYAMLSFFRDIYVLYISRAISGLSYSISVAVAPIYLSEITENHNRGKFGSFVGISNTLSTLYTFAVAPFFPLPIFTLMYSLPQLISLPCLLFIPETPVQLMSKGDRKGALKSLRKFRGRQNVQDDIEEIESILNSSNRNEGKGMLALFRNSSLKKALIIALGINFLQQFAGYSAVFAFLGPMFISAGTNQDVACFLVGIVQVASGIFTAMVIDKVGRRILLLISTSAGSVFFALLAVLYYLKHIHFNGDYIAWLVVACVILLFVGCTIGIGTIPLILVSEIFPNDVKSISMSLSIFFGGLGAAISVFGFPLLMGYIGLFWCFWICSGISLLTTAFVHFCVPETMGKNVAEIQKNLNS